MAALEVLAQHRCHGGQLSFVSMLSVACAGPMRFGIFVPPQASAARLAPALYCLAGLTCNEETFLIKAGALRAAAQHGLVLVAPDTSPRQTGLAGAVSDWEFGEGASFYLDATEAPWSSRFGMASFVTRELTALVETEFPVDPARRGLLGHSMGGHGALTLALKHPGHYQSVSAFAPICAPIQVPWGQKALPRFLGEDPAAWAAHDAVALLKAGHSLPGLLLVDQGLADKFLDSQLRPELLEAACTTAGQPLMLRRHGGYDHGYWFIQSFIEDHVQHHARALGLAG